MILYFPLKNTHTSSKETKEGRATFSCIVEISPFTAAFKKQELGLHIYLESTPKQELQATQAASHVPWKEIFAQW